MKKSQGILFVVLVLWCSLAHAQWMYTDLHPAGAYYSGVLGVSPGDQVGYAYDVYSNSTYATRWQGSPNSVVNLAVGRLNCSALATDGMQQVGAVDTGINGLYSAAHWLGTPSSLSGLPQPLNSSHQVATSMFGQSYGGYGFFSSNGVSGQRALFWPSLTDDPVVLIPRGFVGSGIKAMHSNFQGGFVTTKSYISMAATWKGNSTSFVNRHPQGYVSSEISGMYEQTAVGFASTTNEYGYVLQHAGVWGLGSDYFMDVHPYGYYSSQLHAVFDSVAAGDAKVNLNSNMHATIWDLNSGRIIDLHQFLPADYIASGARAIWGGLQCGTQVGGWALSATDGQMHAMLWSIPWC